MNATRYQRIIRVPQGCGLPLGVEFVKLLGTEYNPLGPAADVVLVEDTIDKTITGVVPAGPRPAPPDDCGQGGP
jgi:hypothetical protein